MFPRPLRPSSGGRPGRTVVVGLLTLGVLLVSGCTGGDEPTSTSEGMFAENKAGTAVQDLVGRAGSGRVSDVTITNDEVRLTTDQGAVFIQPSQGEVYTTRAAGEADAPTFDATAWDLAALGDQLRAKTPPTCPGAAVGRLRPLVVDRPVLELSCPDPNQRPVWLEPDGSELPDLDLTEPTDLAAAGPAGTAVDQ
ncbi:MAG: hypothetical protein L0G99_17050, partial [Propionibacteriales bacterium]|nr:hypothetical protein [Propionibacteriales bacterium]